MIISYPSMMLVIGPSLFFCLKFCELKMIEYFVTNYFLKYIELLNSVAGTIIQCENYV